VSEFCKITAADFQASKQPREQQIETRCLKVKRTCRNTHYLDRADTGKKHHGSRQYRSAVQHVGCPGIEKTMSRDIIWIDGESGGCNQQVRSAPEEFEYPVADRLALVGNYYRLDHTAVERLDLGSDDGDKAVFDQSLEDFASGDQNATRALRMGRTRKSGP